MRAESDVHHELSGVLKVEIEEKFVLDMTAAEDLHKVGGECNGTAHHQRGQEIHENGKGVMDSSYVFVGGDDAEPLVDDPSLKRDLNAGGRVHQMNVLESNVASPDQETAVQGGGPVIDDGNDVQFCGEGNCTAEGSTILPSNGDLASDGEVTRIDTIKKQNGTMAVDSELRKLGGVVKVLEELCAGCRSPVGGDLKGEFKEEKNVAAIADFEDSQQSQISNLSSAESELQPLSNRQDNAGVDSKYTAVMEENKEAQSVLSEAVQVDLDGKAHIVVNDRIQVDMDCEAPVIVKENVEDDLDQDAQLIVNKDDQVNLGLDYNTAESASGMPVESPPRDIVVDLEMNSETTAGHVNNLEFESQVYSGPVLIENGDSWPAYHVEDGVSETEVNNDFNDGTENLSSLNASSENVAGMPSSVEVGNLAVCSELPVESPPRDIVVDLEVNFKTTADHVNNLESESQVYNGPALIENGDSRPTYHVENVVSETEINTDFNDGTEDPSSLNASSKNVAGMPSSVEVGNLAVASEMPVESPPRDIVVDLEMSSKTTVGHVNSLESESQVYIGPVLIENGDSMPSYHVENGVSETEINNDFNDGTENPSSLNSSSENVEGMPLSVEVGNLAVASEMPVESPPRDIVLDFEMNSKTIAGHMNNLESESQVYNGPVLIENGDSWHTYHVEDGVSKTEINNDFNDSTENPSSLNASSENVEGMPLYVEVGNLAVASEMHVESPPRDIVLDLEMKSKTIAGHMNNLESESQVYNGPVLIENGDRWHTYHVEDGVSKTEINNDFNDGTENPSSLNASSENVEGMPLSVEVGNLIVASGDNLPNDIKTETEEEEGASLIIYKCTVGAVGNVGLETVVDVPIVQNSELSCPANPARSEIVFGSLDYDDKVPCFSSGDVNVEFKFSNGITKCASSQPAFTQPDVKSKFEVENTTDLNCALASGDENVQFESSNGIAEYVGSQPACPQADVKSVLEVQNTYALSNVDAPSESEHSLDCVQEVLECENEEDQFATGNSNDTPACLDVEGTEGLHKDETSISSPKISSTDALDGLNAGSESGKRPFYFLIRIPRFDDEQVREQIKHAQLLVDEKTQSRDAVRAQIQMRRATCKECSEKFEAAVFEEKTVRDLLKSKRQEIDSAQSVINIVRNANSVDDVVGRIQSIEHMIEHESLPLTEEKQYLREIKQLKYHLEHISSNMAKEEELQQALDQKDEVGERMKILRKEADSLKDKVSAAEVNTKAAKKIYLDEKEKLNTLQVQFKAADDVRQEAYAHLQSLRKNLAAKNKYFRMYKDDIEKASKLVSEKNKEALQCLCVDQVEKFMDLWNKDDEFRKEYVQRNIRSTLRRLKTLDGRALGPDEEPPVLGNLVNQKVDYTPYTQAKGRSRPVISIVEQEKQVVPVHAEKADRKSTAEVVAEPKNAVAKTKRLAKSSVSVSGSATVSGRDEAENAEVEDKQSKEESELARQAEELRKEEAAAKLKEQRRLEEKAKAKEAQERKKRNAEKARAKAELRAQKEAEQKEKEREKRARKKERKKATVAAESTNGSSEGECAAISESPSETSKEFEIREKPGAVTKRPQRPQFAKCTKAKSIPLPFRNRSKRRMQPWMWALLATLLVLALFFVGNSFSLNFGLQGFGF